MKVFEYPTPTPTPPPLALSSQLGLIASLRDTARLLKSCVRRRRPGAELRVGSGACSRTAEDGQERETEVIGRDRTSSNMTR